jgi:hypothetical protein
MAGHPWSCERQQSTVVYAHPLRNLQKINAPDDHREDGDTLGGASTALCMNGGRAA